MIRKGKVYSEGWQRRYIAIYACMHAANNQNVNKQLVLRE